MADSLPFNEFLAVGNQPTDTEIKLSLFADFGLMVTRMYNFTIFNYRDGQAHKIKVAVDEAKRDEVAKLFWLSGQIIEIDDKRWGPPANEFLARYEPKSPEHSGFKIISNV